MSLLPSCREVADVTSRDEVASLGLLRRLAFRWHLCRCEDCRTYRDQLRAIGRAVRTMYRVPDETLRERERLARLEDEILSGLGAPDPSRDQVDRNR